MNIIKKYSNRNELPKEEITMPETGYWNLFLTRLPFQAGGG
jgi:hypothetical protein